RPPRPTLVPSTTLFRSPQITGDDHALPWIGVFHFTFLPSPSSVGSPFASLWPSPAGPRNCGQFSPANVLVAASARRKADNFIGRSEEHTSELQSRENLV